MEQCILEGLYKLAPTTHVLFLALFIMVLLLVDEAS